MGVHIFSEIQKRTIFPLSKNYHKAFLPFKDNICTSNSQDLRELWKEEGFYYFFSLKFYIKDFM